MTDDADVVWRAPAAGPIYHTDRDCPQLHAGCGSTATPAPVRRRDLADRWRECDRCRYADLPALEEADERLVTDGGKRAGDGVAHVVPWATVVAGVLLVLGLFAGVLGGLL